jgi:hypothetical protein
MHEAMLGNMPTVDAGQFQWLVWAVGIAISAMSGAVIWLYKDNKEDRKAYSEKLEKIIERSENSRELNNLALQGLTQAVDELRKDIRERRV